MEVEKALDFIRPANAVFRMTEQGLRSEEGVNDDLTGLTPPGGLQCRVEAAKEGWWTGQAARMHDEIETGGADQIESGQIVSCPGNAGNGDVRTPEITETIQQNLGWTRTPRRVHETLTRPGFLGLGDQLEPGFLRKGAQFDPAI